MRQYQGNYGDLLYTSYNEQFGKKIDLVEFKRRPESIVIASNGRKCSRQIFTEERSKRAKTIIDFVEENTFSDLKLYTKVREQLRKELAGIKATKVEEVPRTKKIFSEYQDSLVLDLLNQAIGEKS